MEEIALTSLYTLGEAFFSHACLYFHYLLKCSVLFCFSYILDYIILFLDMPMWFLSSGYFLTRRQENEDVIIHEHEWHNSHAQEDHYIDSGTLIQKVFKGKKNLGERRGGGNKAKTEAPWSRTPRIAPFLLWSLCVLPQHLKVTHLTPMASSYITTWLEVYR